VDIGSHGGKEFFVSKTTVHVISHTHWDREWYFTDDDSQVFMAMAFSELLDALEDNPAIKSYMLDAQTSILEEYLRMKPEDRPRVEKLVSCGRLVTGPWYSQPDVFNVQGESILRNLLIGMKQAESLGRCMMVGYLPDTFGFNAQMPLIFEGVGLKHAVIRRGYDPSRIPSTEFRWVALDGKSSVVAAVQPYGYSMAHPKRGGRMRNFSREQLFKETYPLLERVEELSNASDVMLTVGGDQVTVDERIGDFIGELQKNDPNKDDVFIQDSIEGYIAALEKEHLDLGDYSGELRMPRFARVHRTIGSVRYDIKQMNYLAEKKLLREAEVMSAISSKLGLYSDTVNIERAWKLILASQAHDSMGGCNSDDTNATVLKRCKDACNTADGVFYLLARLVSENVYGGGHESHFLLVNGGFANKVYAQRCTVLTSAPDFAIVDAHGRNVDFAVLSQKAHPYERKVEINVDGESESADERVYYENEILLPEAEVPQLGYATFYIDPVDSGSKHVAETTNAAIENSTWRISAKEGHIAVRNNVTGQEIDDAFWLEDCANDGDLYDFSPLEHDDTSMLRVDRVIRCCRFGDVQSLELACRAEVPCRLNDERTARVGKAVVPINLTLSISGSDLIDMKVHIDNTALDHRMRLVFNTQIASTDTRAGVPYGTILRKKTVPASDWADTYGECPIDIYPVDGFVELKDGSRAAAIFTEGCKEYQVLEEGRLALTLFSTAGSLGKCDLAWRPGRESGRPVPTPESELLGPLDFHLGFWMGEPAGAAVQIADLAEEFRSCCTSYQTQGFFKSFQRMDYFDVNIPHAEVPDSCSLVSSVPSGIGFGSITQANGSLLLRIFNQTDTAIACSPEELTGDGDAAAADCWGNRTEQWSLVLPNAFANVLIPDRK
jgi:hypothetical protein